LSKLQAENEELRRRLEEAEETIDAIRSGAVDALVVEEPDGHRVYTLKAQSGPTGCSSRRCNRARRRYTRTAPLPGATRNWQTLLKTPQEKLLGAALVDFVPAQTRVVYDNLLWQGQTRSGRGEVQLRRSDGGWCRPFLLSMPLPKDCGRSDRRAHHDLTDAAAPRATDCGA
jgi:two-component system CheB/CheR fusion protein